MSVQNFAARIISNTRKSDHVTPVLKEVYAGCQINDNCIIVEVVLAFKCMTGQAPAYLSSLFLKRAEISGRETRNS